MQTGAELVVKTVDQIVLGKNNEILQESLIRNSVVLKQAPKIFKEDCRINWNQDVLTIHNFIRGLSPHPGAFTEFKMTNGGTNSLKIFRVIPEQIDPPGVPGEFFTNGKSFLKVGAKNGFIHVTELQLPGRKVMSTADFLRGFSGIFSETHGI